MKRKNLLLLLIPVLFFRLHRAEGWIVSGEDEASSPENPYPD